MTEVRKTDLLKLDLISPTGREVLLEIYALCGGETTVDARGAIQGELRQQFKLAPSYIKRKRFTFERLAALRLIRLEIKPAGSQFSVSLTLLGKKLAEAIQQDGGGVARRLRTAFFQPAHSYVRSAYADRGPMTHMVFRVEYVGLHPNNDDERVAFGWSKYERDGSLWAPCSQGETSWSRQHWQDLGPTLRVDPASERETK